MYLEYYNLKEHPFGVTPDPRFLYLSNTHKEAIAALSYGLECGLGIVLLTAVPGTGKTTLLFNLLNQLNGHARTAFVCQTQCDSREFLREVVTDLELPIKSGDCIQGELRRMLLEEAQAGRRVVLVVDEAQNLTDSVLETLRLLSDYETSSRKLLQIVLAAQTELLERIRRQQLRNLRQRITVAARLQPLTAAETRSYIQHRLKIAGHFGPAVFTNDACDRIAALSEGIPRNINTLCFGALSHGYALNAKPIGRGVIEEISREFKFEEDLSLPASTETTGSDASNLGRTTKRFQQAPMLAEAPRDLNPDEKLTSTACSANAPDARPDSRTQNGAQAGRLPGSAAAVEEVSWQEIHPSDNTVQKRQPTEHGDKDSRADQGQDVEEPHRHSTLRKKVLLPWLIGVLLVMSAVFWWESQRQTDEARYKQQVQQGQQGQPTVTRNQREVNLPDLPSGK